MRNAEHSETPIAIQATVQRAAIEHTEGFVLVALPSKSFESAIRIEVRRKDRSVVIEWLAGAARECAQILRELVK